MTTPSDKAGKSGALDLLERVDRLADSVPTGQHEAEELLAEAGIDATKELTRALAVVAQAKAQAVATRFANARRERLATAAGLKVASRPRRTRAENLGLIAALAARFSAGRELVVQHRDFESAPDEDVDSLAAELELLAERHDLGKK
jgi:hypothetical protein